MRPRWLDRALCVYEIKHDGYRLCAGMAFAFAASRATAMTGPRFPVIVGAAARLKAQSFLIDGEVVIARDDCSTLVQRAISF
jgi:ATP-dependent DNA ligase